MTKFQAIRNVAAQYGHASTNKQIKEKVSNQYGIDVTGQNINAAIGPHKKRKLMGVDCGSVYETKLFCQKHFNDDINLLHEVVKLIRGNTP